MVHEPQDLESPARGGLKIDAEAERNAKSILPIFPSEADGRSSQSW